MRIVYRAQNLIDAQLVKDALQAAGVPAFIAGEYLTGGVGQLPALGCVAVMVPEISLDAAESIVREIDHALTKGETGAAEWDGDADSLAPETT